MKTTSEPQTGTRERVRGLLLALGPSTAAVLSDRLGLSPAAVRKHLDALLLDGTVTTREQRPRGARGRGRPARQYVLTDAGHAEGPSGYDDLAAAAVRFLAQAGGAQAVIAFAEARGADLERRYAGVLAGLAAEDRPAALAEALTADGYAASTSQQGLGLQLCQHHCPSSTWLRSSRSCATPRRPPSGDCSTSTSSASRRSPTETACAPPLSLLSLITKRR